MIYNRHRANCNRQLFMETKARPSSAAKTALLQPGKAFNFWRRTGSRVWIEALFCDSRAYQRHVAELLETRLLENLTTQLNCKFSKITGTTSRGNRYTPGAMLSAQASHLYAIIRERKPRVIIETGVCNGLSSAIALAALARNNFGHLYSIDLPEFTGQSNAVQRFWSGKGGAVVPADQCSGWLVPEALRGRWTLRLGKSSELLPKLLDEVSPVNLFIHDSEHSFENQLFEFRAAFARLTTGGVIFASDINWSKAFDVFAGEVSQQARKFFIDYSLGLVVRN